MNMFSKSLSVAEIREIKRRRAMGGRLAFQKETASSTMRKGTENREKRRKKKKKKKPESRADDRDEIDENASGEKIVKKSKSDDDLSSLYANHPSITFIP